MHGRARPSSAATFQVPDTLGRAKLADFLNAYSTPLLAGIVSAAAYALLARGLGRERSRRLALVYATASVALYYFYRLPALLGFGIIPGDGVLVDLSRTLPGATPILLRILSTGLVVWWMLLRGAPGSRWTFLVRTATKSGWSPAATSAAR